MNEILFSAQQMDSQKRKRFGRRAFSLEHISFDLPQGYIMGLIGKNGAGKTTFFEYIMSEKKRYSGSLLLDGREIHENHLWTLNHIGFVSEKNEFLEARTGKQNAQMLGRFYADFDMELFLQTMDALDLSADKTIGIMSRGECMKFQLAFATAHHPRLYLLDEATAGMDPVFRIDFYRMLRQLLEREHCSVILSTHLEEEIEKQLDYICVLEEGRFVSFRENLPA